MTRAERRSRPARWAMLGLLAASIAATASRADQPAPDAVLREKGLTRAGSLYLLKEEAGLKERVDEIHKVYAAWDQSGAQLAEALASLKQMQLRSQDLLQRQKALEEVWQDLVKSWDPPHPPAPPPPRSGFNPPP